MKKLSDTYYDSQIASKRNEHFNMYRKNDGVTDIMLYEIEQAISKKKKFKLLDLGTGNGFILRELITRNQIPIDNSVLIGIDNSKLMLEDASRQLNEYLLHRKNYLKLAIMNNNDLKFKDNCFDIITAKAVTNISIKEIYRTLKPDGWFIYKEYGLGKGLVELMNLISDVNQQHPGDHLVKKIQQNKFSEVQIRKYYIPLERSIDEVNSIFSTMRILPAGNKDYRQILPVIEKYYKGDLCKKIHSDPYLILAKK